MKKINLDFKKITSRGKIPTLLGLFLVAMILFLSFLIKEKRVFRPRAGSDFSPQEVRITNITDRSFSVSWKTSINTTGAVKLLEKKRERLILDVRKRETGKDVLSEVHYAQVEGVEPETRYQFWINSGGKDYGKKGEKREEFEVKTAKLFSGQPTEGKLAFGKVVDQKNHPVKGAIVYLDVPGVAPLSSLTSSQGNWVIPLAFAFNQSLTRPADYQEGEIAEEINVDAGSRGKGKAVNYTRSNKPVEDLILGKSLDFTLSKGENQEKKREKSKIPEGETSSLGGKEVSQFKVISPQEGEEVRTSRPEIFGVGPQGGKVEIVIESETKYQGKLEIGPDGEWHWTPSGDLSPGEHKLMVRFTDPSGKEEIFQKNFVVLSGGGEGPAFTATSSGETVTPSPSPTATPTLSPTPTPTPTAFLTPTPSKEMKRSTLPSTESGVPRTGLLTPAIFFFTMGVLMIAGGILLKEKMI